LPTFDAGEIIFGISSGHGNSPIHASGPSLCVFLSAYIGQQIEQGGFQVV
jgi:hypothetical protein